MLPTPFCQYFQLGQGTTFEQFLDRLDFQYDDRLDGLLASEESRAAALESLATAYDVEIARCVAPVEKWRYSAVQSEGWTSHVWLLGNLEQSQGNLHDVLAVPTDLESLILHFLVADQRQWQGKLWNNPERVNWRSVLSGHALIACPRDPGLNSANLRRLIAAIFKIEHAELPRITVASSLIELASSITVKSSEVLNTLSKTKLLSEAVAEMHPKWRFLSFYRIVENAYLTNIKKRFIQSFDIDAKNAVKEAEKSLQSEMNQLNALAEENDLIPAFEPFNAQFDVLLAAQNRFIHSIERSASEEPLYKMQGTYKKAVVRFYKLRCSIAHGGTSSTIFEEHQDGNDALTSLMADVEAIAMKCLELELD
ncbi:hypothetical protein [Massilia sp. TS11]|uniref:hypothetical protein n=1 Tax=Massilia sp. TS11 TaxID=2908003 RepID=UPI001EDC3BC0|nr:hypothetical protein [Massilia sp. TS11]MCG2583505.1 hypothetical protein [Massilia sp. TS11]